MYKLGKCYEIKGHNSLNRNVTPFNMWPLSAFNKLYCMKVQQSGKLNSLKLDVLIHISPRNLQRLWRDLIVIFAKTNRGKEQNVRWHLKPRSGENKRLISVYTKEWCELVLFSILPSLFKIIVCDWLLHSVDTFDLVSCLCNEPPTLV